MKTITQTALLCLLLTLIFSCKKETATPAGPLDESYYKEKLTEMVHLSPSNTAKSLTRSSGGDNELKFDTYKQAYEFFNKLLASKDSMSLQVYGVDSLLPTSTSNLSVSTLATNGTQYMSFTGQANNTVTVYNSFGTGTINVIYLASVSVAYPFTESNGVRTYNGKQPINSTASSLGVVYKGLGAIESQNSIINAQPGGGNVSGNMQGVFHVGDSELSFYISWSSQYYWELPQLPTGTAIFHSTLTASAS
ncbi:MULTISPECIES: hypothetical protein [unclassified Chitinophaga]|uniref:hypothetical protein n=1 Tax=unclassified Chitinophaga TaxID=2619133 RepID=UPI003010590B